MSRFLERFAKLTTDIEENGDEFTINVYDDELDTKKPVMFLYGMEKYSEDVNPNSNYHGVIAYVESINFDNELFFKLPPDRQDRCGVVLLLRFNKFYKERFGNDIAIGADFMNYELQERFKEAIKNGMYPEDSLDFIGETTEDNWKKEQHYNMDNRKKMNDIKGNPDEFFSSLGLNYENGFFVNNSISSILNAFNDNESAFLNRNLFGKIENGNVYVTQQLITSYTDIDSNNMFTYYDDNKRVFIVTNSIEQLLEQSESNMRNVFDSVSDFRFESQSYSIEDFYALKNKKEASNKTRLKKG